MERKGEGEGYLSQKDKGLFPDRKAMWPLSNQQFLKVKGETNPVLG